MITKRKGRPFKLPEPGKRVALGLRVTADVKATIDDAARTSGRTQSQEAEILIEKALIYDRMASKAKGKPMNSVVKQAEQKIVSAAKRSVLLDMAERFGMEPQAFEAVVRSTCLPPDRKTGRQASREEFAAFLLVAKEYNLNPLTKEIFGFVAKSGGIQPVVSVDGWSNLMNSHPAFDGMEFEDHPAGDRLIAITCRIYRKDRSHPITATEYMAECHRDTEPWNKWPRRMLRHKAMIQAARYAFGFAGVYDPDEADRMSGDLARDVTPLPRQSVEDAFNTFAGEEPHDPETGEVEENFQGESEAVARQLSDEPAAPTDHPPPSPTVGAAPIPTAEDYVNTWNSIIDAAVPSQANQIQQTWDEGRKIRNRITWPEDDTFSRLEHRVKSAIKELRQASR